MKSAMTEPSPDEVAQLQATMKAELRRRMRSVRALLPAPACAERSQQACARVQALPQYARARTLLAYVATRKELDPQPLATHALGFGAGICCGESFYSPRIRQLFRLAEDEGKGLEPVAAAAGHESDNRR